MNRKEEKNILRNAKGITLIALVVTIIVLIILAGISINLVLGENGIITKAQQTKDATEQAKLNEEVATNELMQQWEDLVEGPKKAEIPEKSETAAFDRSYGVIEIEFLKGTGYTTTSTPNLPKMGSNMKKVYWEDDGTEKVEGSEGFDESKWYSYIAQTGNTESGGTSKWANAATVDDEGNITGYFVWIPRYAYRIVYFDTPEHESAYRLTGATDGIVGYSDSRGLVHPDGTTPSDMEEPVTSISVGTNKLRPHPAFEDGSTTGYTQGEWNTALEGIWIAKYETSGTSSSLKSVPGVQALVSTKIGDMYTYALGFNEINKSHMLKNSEWGAVTYLTESKYGRNGISVMRNAEGIYTAGAEGATVVNNPLQSTTGNYYGIYDTVGGASEYIAGYIADNSKNSGNSFASTDNSYNNKIESTQYATVYNIGIDGTNTLRTQNYIENVNKKFGDATIETSTAGSGTTSWNSAYSSFVGFNGDTSNYPFFRLGSNYKDENWGLFAFNYTNGASVNTNSFRICLITK